MLCDQTKWTCFCFLMRFPRKAKTKFVQGCIWISHLCRICFQQWIRSGTKWLHVCCLVLTDQEKNLKISALMHVKYRGIWRRFVKYIYLPAKSHVLVHMDIFVLRSVCVRGHNSWSIHSNYKWLHYLDILSHSSLRLKQNTASPVTSSSKFDITSSVG